jgi:hypothetical protein
MIKTVVIVKGNRKKLLQLVPNILKLCIPQLKILSRRSRIVLRFRLGSTKMMSPLAASQNCYRRPTILQL